MLFGTDTVKPDQRVIEVLDNEFGCRNINQLNSINAVEQIAEITGKPALLIDQIFVLYGSGYYNRHEKLAIKLTNEGVVNRIAKNLKDLNVEASIIAQATGLSLQRINDI